MTETPVLREYVILNLARVKETTLSDAKNALRHTFGLVVPVFLSSVFQVSYFPYQSSCTSHLDMSR